MEKYPALGTGSTHKQGVLDRIEAAEMGEEEEEDEDEDDEDEDEEGDEEGEGGDDEGEEEEDCPPIRTFQDTIIDSASSACD